MVLYRNTQHDLFDIFRSVVSASSANNAFHTIISAQLELAKAKGFALKTYPIPKI